MRRFFVIACVVLAGVPHLTAQTITYSSHIRPLFVSYECTNCHGGSGGLFLDTYTGLMTTGDHKPVVVPRDTNSVLVKKLKGTAGFGARMPLSAPPMDAGDLRTIIQWIANGAPETTTAVDDRTTGAPIASFMLHQNYPNPFNPTTTIRFSLEERAVALMRVFDVRGKELGILFHAEAAAGEVRQVSFDAGDLTSGIYFIRLESGNRVATQKMILLK